MHFATGTLNLAIYQLSVLLCFSLLLAGRAADADTTGRRLLSNNTEPTPAPTNSFTWPTGDFEPLDEYDPLTPPGYISTSAEMLSDVYGGHRQLGCKFGCMKVPAFHPVINPNNTYHCQTSAGMAANTANPNANWDEMQRAQEWNALNVGCESNQGTCLPLEDDVRYQLEQTEDRCARMCIQGFVTQQWVQTAMLHPDTYSWIDMHKFTCNRTLAKVALLIDDTRKLVRVFHV